MRAEIWMGGRAVVVLAEVKRVDLGVDGVFVKITDRAGNEFETSPHNVLLIKDNDEKGGNNNA